MRTRLHWPGATHDEINKHVDDCFREAIAEAWGQGREASRGELLNRAEREIDYKWRTAYRSAAARILDLVNPYSVEKKP